MTVTAAVLHAARDLRIQPWPDPVRRAGEALVAVTSVGICGSDVHYFRDGALGRTAVEAPIILGHEPAGRVLECDPSSGLRVGQRVAIEPHRPCGHCRQCWAGAYNMCPSVEFMANPPVHGALVERVCVPADFLFPVPDSVSDDEAALCEPLAVGLWAAHKTRVTAGDRVLVSGAGPIGLLAAQVCVARGATQVTVTDVNEHRVRRASELPGVVGVLAEAAGLPESDVLIECSGAAGSLRTGSLALAPHGRIAAVGLGRDPEDRLDVLQIQSRELELHGSYRYVGQYPTAIRLIAERRVDVAGIVTHRFALSEAEAAFTIGERDPHAVKSIVRVGE